MDKWSKLRQRFYFLVVVFVIFIVVVMTFPWNYRTIPKPIRNLQHVSNSCPLRIADQTITPLMDTKHMLVSAYMDQRVNGYDVRIISIFRRDSIQPLHCLFCCAGQLSNTTTPATIKGHSDNFGFAFGTTDVLCQIPQDCSATHVNLLTQPGSVNVSSQTWLPIRNRKTSGQVESMQFNITVCISTLFEFNNVLQFAQTLELYRILDVDRVVIYNTSCGPDLDRLLQSYVREGFVEIVPWPIDKHLTPSRGWLFSESGGDLHYFGQLAALNECIYRSMDRSRYVLLHDIDEIMMPYQHNSLKPMIDMLQQQHPNIGVFLVENHVYPKKPFEESKPGPLPQWRGVPGFDILEHIYKWIPNKMAPYRFHKLIVQPRMVEQTSVHIVPVKFGEEFMVPPELCHIIHTPLGTPSVEPVERIQLDARLWDFKDRLIPVVNNVLMKTGLLH